MQINKFTINNCEASGENIGLHSSENFLQCFRKSGPANGTNKEWMVRENVSHAMQLTVVCSILL